MHANYALQNTPTYIRSVAGCCARFRPCNVRVIFSHSPLCNRRVALRIVLSTQKRGWEIAAVKFNRTTAVFNPSIEQRTSRIPLGGIICTYPLLNDSSTFELGRAITVIRIIMAVDPKRFRLAFSRLLSSQIDGYCMLLLLLLLMLWDVDSAISAIIVELQCVAV